MSDRFVGAELAYSEEMHQQSIIGRLASRTDGFVPFELNRDETVLTRFARQVQCRGQKPAVSCDDGALTYLELDRLSNTIGLAIRRKTSDRQTPIVILLPTRSTFFGAVLGALKGGSSYIALDPAFPEARNALILQECNARLIVTERKNEELAERLASVGQTIMYLDDIGADSEELFGDCDPDRLVCTIFTSGSTGRPKGVMHTHRTLLSVVKRWTNSFYLSANDRVTLLSSGSVSASFTTMFSALLTGATVFPFPARERELSALADWLDEKYITLYNSVPSLFRHLMQSVWTDRVFPTIRLVRLGGDSVYRSDWELFKKHFTSDAVLVNSYGSTEVSNVMRFYMDAASRFSEEVVPIGYPLDGDVRVSVMDGDGATHIAGDGGRQDGARAIVGEIVLESRFLSPGYLNDGSAPEHGVRTLWTGDLGSLRAGYGITHLGRGDSQVKVSGFRVEIAEVEACLRRFPGVNGAAVLIHSPAHGERELIGFVKAEDPRDDLGARIRAFALDRLPSYMVPSQIVVVREMPSTPNGKVDRSALLQLREETKQAQMRTAPRTPEERFVVECWRRVLRCGEIGVDDNFFSLGGNSLFALRAFNELRPVAKNELSLLTFFTLPTAREVARWLDVGTGRDGAATSLPVITRAPRGKPIPMSFAQQRLWILAQLEGASEAYNIPLGFRLRGPLDRNALRAALSRIVARHEALRTTFGLVGETPMQRIAAVEEARFSLCEEDVSGCVDPQAALAGLVTDEARAAFDLSSGPLIRGRLIRESDETSTLLITMHHIVSDGWSMGVFGRELSTLYGAFTRGRSDPLHPLDVQYADYSVWQRTWIEAAVVQEQAQYWKSVLHDAPALSNLPTDRARPLQQDYRGASFDVVLDEALTTGLRSLSRRHDTTLFMTVLAGWSIVLSRLGGQSDVVIGTPVANRGYSGIEALIGFFVNTLALRFDVGGGLTVAQVLAQVKARTLAAQQNGDIPFEHVVELINPTRSLAYSPLVQVVFAWNNTPNAGLILAGLDAQLLERAPSTVTKFDLTLTMQEAGDRITGNLTYATSLFDAATIERFAVYFRRVLEAMVAG